MALTFNQYAQQASTTAIYSATTAIEYTTLGLCSEAGEVAGVLKRYQRGDHKELNKEKMLLEIGDVLWYCAELSKSLGSDLETVARLNMNKLAKRQVDGTIKGSGDYR
jgi:NTP pyrophosphatase (non-canonical NTP hydrolase)